MEVQASHHPVLTLAMEVPQTSGMPVQMPAALRMQQGAPIGGTVCLQELSSSCLALTRTAPAGTLVQRRTRTMTVRRTIAVAVVPALGVHPSSPKGNERKRGGALIQHCAGYL